MDSPTELTPQERLAISRKAIVRHMNRHFRKIENLSDEDFDHADVTRPVSHGTWSIIKRAARVWWYRHPASAAAELASPLLSDYAKEHPFKLLGISTAIGAAVVVIRPWRMMSIGGLVVAAVKSSGLTNTLVSMLSSVTRHPEHTNTTP